MVHTVIAPGRQVTRGFRKRQWEAKAASHRPQRDATETSFTGNSEQVPFGPSEHGGCTTPGSPLDGSRRMRYLDSQGKTNPEMAELPIAGHLVARFSLNEHILS